MMTLVRRSPSQAGLAFCLVAVTLAACAGAYAQQAPIGFQGDFATWQTPCVNPVNYFNCGYVLDSSNAIVNAPDAGTSPYTYWMNSGATRSSAYLLSFGLALYWNNPIDLPSSTNVGFYQVGDDSLNRVSFALGGGGVFTTQLDAGVNFYFGIESDEFVLTKGNDLTLSVSNFSATSVTAPLVPAPLPAIGAASLFLGSRRLKKRMVQQRVLRLARRNLAPAIRSILPG